MLLKKIYYKLRITEYFFSFIKLVKINLLITQIRILLSKHPLKLKFIVKRIPIAFPFSDTDNPLIEYLDSTHSAQQTSSPTEVFGKLFL